MAGADHREVASVERRNLLLAERLAECDHRGVDESEVEIPIPALELCSSLEVSDRERLEPVAARGDVLDEQTPGVRTQELVGPVVDLHQHTRGKNEILVDVVDHLDAALVRRIAGVEQRQHGPRVENERHSLRSQAIPERSLLVGGGCPSGSAAAPCYPEAGAPGPPETLSLPCDELAEEEGEGYLPTLRLAFEQCKIVCFGSESCPADRHCI